MRFVRVLALCFTVFCTASAPAPDDQAVDILFIQQMWSYTSLILPGLPYKKASEQFAFMCNNSRVVDKSGCITGGWQLAKKYEEVNDEVFDLVGTPQDRALEGKMTQELIDLQRSEVEWWRANFLQR